MIETETTLAERKTWAIAHLYDFQETHDPCEQGHVEHDAAAHLGRRLVHSMAGGFGADWDYESAVEYIKAADAVIERTPPHMGHRIAARSPEGRWVAFETRDDPS